MKRKFILFLFLLFLTLALGNVERILACSCIPKSPCQKFQNADAVFVGKVVEMRQIQENAFAVYFEVSESFKGVKIGERVKIFSHQNDGGSCGYRFEESEVSLVFARNNADSASVSGLWTHQCSGNKPIEYAEESLIFLRKFLSENSGTMIVGSIQDMTEKKRRNVSVEGIRIKALQINSKKVFYGTTNQDGFYEIKVPVGTYQVTPELPDGVIFGELDYKENKPIKVEKLKCNGKFFLILGVTQLKGKCRNTHDSRVCFRRRRTHSTIVRVSAKLSQLRNIYKVSKVI